MESNRSYLLILFFLSILCSFSPINAQWVVEPTNPSAEYSRDDYFVAEAELFNNSSSPKTFRWKRLTLNLPERWTSAICDPVLCYSHTIDSSEFVLEAF